MKWTSAFSYLPINYSVVFTEVADQTQRVVFDNNLNGNKVRMRLSNRYSSNVLVLHRVTVGIMGGGQAGKVKEVTLRGDGIIRLQPGEECYSDEVELAVRAGDKIGVFIYIKSLQPIESVCTICSREGAIVSYGESGDFMEGDDFCFIPKEDSDAEKEMFFYGFSGVQVLTQDSVKTIAAFGDSITHMSYVTNALCKRLYSSYPGQAALLNRGIGGNRLLYDATYTESVLGNGSCFGEAGIKRFEKDIFGEESVDAVIVLEGINDIMHPIQFDMPHQIVKPEELEQGYKQVAAIAHRHGAKIFVATITPCGSRDYPDGWMTLFEKIRVAVNDRIRSGLDYDGYFDYDKAVRDEEHPEYMNVKYHLGDGVHPNDIGGEVMAAQVDLRRLME